MGEKVAQSVGVLSLSSIIVLSHMWYAPTIISGGNLGSSQENMGAGDALRQICFLALFVMSAGALVLKESCRSLMRVPWIFLPFLVWCWISLLWAEEPTISLRRLIFSTMILLSISYAVKALHLKTILKILTISFATMLLLDWVSIALFPFSVHQPGESYGGAETAEALVGNWRGLHQEKNQAGAFAAAASILMIYIALKSRSYLTGLLLSAMAITFLYYTRSKTSLGLVLPALIIGAMAHYGFNNPVLRLVAAFAGFIGVLIMVFFSETIISNLSQMLDDPAAFTGRSQLWQVLLNFVADHPVLGSGYGSFWDIGIAGPMNWYASGWLTKVYVAHNGYLDILVQTGIVGLILVLYLLVIHPLFVLFSKPLPQGVPRVLIASSLAFVILHNLLEASFYDRANPTWVFALIIYNLLFKFECRRSADEAENPSLSLR